MTRRPTPPDTYLAPAEFFQLRTPLLPVDDFLAWGAGLRAPAALAGDPAALEQALADDRAVLRARLRALVARPEVHEALFVSSPAFARVVPVWLAAPASAHGRRIEHALVKYVTRMACRTPPYGLFAGCSVGTLGAAPRLALAPRSAYRRATRLDLAFFTALAEALARDPALRAAVRFAPNSSLHALGGELRYTPHARGPGAAEPYAVVAVAPTAYLAATLALARGGAPPATLAAALCAADPDVPPEEARGYVDALIDQGLLTSELEPAVTRDALDDLRQALARAGATEPAGVLADAARDLAALDAEPLGVAPARYDAIAARLAALPAPPDRDALFLVDLYKPGEVVLTADVATEVTRAAELLLGLYTPPPSTSLQRFRDAFAARYEDRWVPLPEALDPDAGVGFAPPDLPRPGADEFEREVPRGPAHPPPDPWSSVHPPLLAILLEALARGAREVSLSPEQLAALRPQDPPTLPRSALVMARLLAASTTDLARGDYRVFVEDVSPYAARWLGRLCPGDPALRAHVVALLRREAALYPGVVFAEVAHLPEGYVGNSARRPALRAYEIPYLGRSGVAPEYQIPLTDLWVGVRDGRVVLRSERLGREVVPQLTCAHNPTVEPLPVYHFLAKIGAQTHPGYYGFPWGPLRAAPALPRVVLGRAVLARARWRLAGPPFAALARAAPERQFRQVQAWRAQRGWPRHVALVRDADELAVDLDNALSVAALVHHLRARVADVEFVEPCLGDDALCVRGPEGRFVHTLVLPLLRRDPPAPPAPPAPASAPPIALRPAGARTFAPGSAWLYAKLYTGLATADRVLVEHVAPWLAAATAAGAVDAWFFIRYADPAPHLRVRLHGDPAALHAVALPGLTTLAARGLAAGLIPRVQLDTYEREVERYGGPVGLALAEQVFHADSVAALALLAAAPDDDDPAAPRWQLVARGVHDLFAAFDVALPARCALLAAWRAAFGREVGATAATEHWLSARYRRERAALAAWLAPTPPDPADPTVVPHALLAERAARLAPLAARFAAADRAGALTTPLPDVLASLAHMHANRLLRTAARTQEFVLYDFLLRAYTSARARDGRGDAAGAP